MTTKKDYIYGEIKNLILNGEFKEGELLISENEICKRYNVSREPVRRALKRLKEKGYIGKNVIIGVRPEHLDDDQELVAANPTTVIKSKVEVTELMGAES